MKNPGAYGRHAAAIQQMRVAPGVKRPSYTDDEYETDADMTDGRYAATAARLAALDGHGRNHMIFDPDMKKAFGNTGAAAADKQRWLAAKEDRENSMMSTVATPPGYSMQSGLPAYDQREQAIAAKLAALEGDGGSGTVPLVYKQAKKAEKPSYRDMLEANKNMNSHDRFKQYQSIIPNAKKADQEQNGAKKKAASPGVTLAEQMALIERQLDADKLKAKEQETIGNLNTGKFTYQPVPTTEEYVTAVENGDMETAKRYVDAYNWMVNADKEYGFDFKRPGMFEPLTDDQIKRLAMAKTRSQGQTAPQTQVIQIQPGQSPVDEMVQKPLQISPEVKAARERSSAFEAGQAISTGAYIGEAGKPLSDTEVPVYGLKFSTTLFDDPQKVDVFLAYYKAGRQAMESKFWKPLNDALGGSGYYGMDAAKTPEERRAVAAEILDDYKHGNGQAGIEEITSPFTQIGAVANGLENEATFGLYEHVAKNDQYNPIAIAQQLYPKEYAIGAFGGQMLPGAAIDRAAVKVIGKIAPKLMKTAPMVYEGLAGMASGAAYSAVRDTVGGVPVEQAIKDIATNSALGFGLGGIYGALKKPVSSNTILLETPDGNTIPYNPKTPAGNKRVGVEYLPLGSRVENAGERKIPWDSWYNYEKVTVDKQLYAIVGDRLFSKHAVDRMQPSGNRFGPYIYQAGGDYGRSVAPQYVEDVLSTVDPVLQDNGNLSFKSGTLEVITNPQGTAVVTIMTYR